MTTRFCTLLTELRTSATVLAFVIAIIVGFSAMSQNAVGQEPEAKQQDGAPKGEEAPPTEVTMADVSYVIGVNIGRNMSNAKIELEFEAFNKGLKAALEGAELKMTDDEMDQVLNAFAEMQQAKEDASKLAFLDENKKKEGVTTTDSGLQYRVMKAGDGSGKRPKADDSVTVNYKGYFIGGEVFDSSIASGEPATFNANQVISGWTEALQLMREGDKWELVLPANLAYGERGNQRIPPNSVLIFEVELIKINAKEE